LLGESLNFSATVSNSNDLSVTWSVDGVSGGSTQSGTITAAGVYTAPADLPPVATVQVTATSVADISKSASAALTITSDISVSLSPSGASTELGATQSFQAAIHSQGLPDPTIRWSLSGTSCPNSCGNVSTTGVYTAPQILPASAVVILIATSVADPSKQNTATLTITSHFTLQLAAPSSLVPGTSGTLVATLTPVPGSNPSTALSWAVTGSGCAASACGVLTVTTSQSAGGAPIANTAVYTAPVTPPEPDSILITVTPLADPAKQVQANITIQSGASIILSPATATLTINNRVTLTAAQGGSSSGSLNWSVNGFPGGSAAFGQICVTGSNPCQPFTSGNATQADYVAPGAIPSPNPVSIMVSSATNPSLSSSAQITVLNHVLVSVLPGSVTLPPLGLQAFSASVLGTGNQSVIWQIQGTGCATAGTCGSLDASGNYTAPGIAPTPNTLQVVAVSQYDPTQSGIANVTISNQLDVLTLHPASVYAGGLDGFTLQVEGSGFVPSSPGPGSTLLIGGSARVTTCASAGSCSAPVTNSDVALPGNLSIQVQNPNSVTSNVVQLVIVQPNIANATIALTTSVPASSGNNITVVEPTTAGIDTSGDDLDLNIAALGTFTTSTNTCALGGSPLPLVPPSSGTITADICLFSEAGLDSSMTYTVSGPGDIALIAQAPAGLGIIHLTLQVPATAAPGARTLFLQSTNLDETSVSGALQVQ
jgi:hypothetical protein